LCGKPFGGFFDVCHAHRGQKYAVGAAIANRFLMKIRAIRRVRGFL
jgi:ABC-type Fe3+/spermidine/putrescine transport system ATPase subunit